MSDQSNHSFTLEKILPLLRLGELIHTLHLQRYPSQRGAFHDCRATAKELRERIHRQEVAAEFTLLSRDAPLRLKKAIQPVGKWSREQTYIIALIAYASFSSIFFDKSVDGIVRSVGVALSQDTLAGSLMARKALLELISLSILDMTDNRIVDLTDEMIEWMTDNNPHLALSPIQTELRRIQAGFLTEEPPQDVFEEYIRNIPIMTPAEMDLEILKLGYVGQEQARRQICLAAYRHVQRLKNQFVLNIDPSTLPARENILMMGNTGSGKTFLIQILFEKILKIPSVVVDITGFTEAGYVGADVQTILTRLLIAADSNIQIAQTGIVAIDEFDKIAGGGSITHVFAGQGTSKDVSGVGVQKSLLKMLEGSVVETPAKMSGTPWREEQVKFDTRNTLFIGLGAFSGFNSLLKNRPHIGFGNEKSGGIEKNISPITAQAFQRYGICSELYGRFGNVLRLDDLSKDQLKSILEGNVIRKYRNELELDGIGLDIDPAVSDLIVEQALANGTGARGLSGSLSSIMSEAQYAIFSTQGTGKRIALYVDNGGDRGIQWGITKDNKNSKNSNIPKKKAIVLEEMPETGAIRAVGA